MSFELLAKKFAYYAYKHLNRTYLDRIYLENILLGEFNCTAPSNEDFDENEIEILETPDILLNELYGLRGSREDNLRYGEKIMGILTEAPSIVNDKFWSLREKGLDSTTYLYNLSIKNNYIKKTAIDKNIKWKYQKDDNFIEITINLTKPEKKNKDIAAALKSNDVKYPKCLLCKENIGFYGTTTHPARENIRYALMKLNNEDFFMQYSPYCYYPEHVIIINSEHIPMSISKNTFSRLCDFVDLIPEYFIGSNADLPIVGGSILSHEHYQGGGYLLPIMYSKDKFIVETKNKDITLSYLEWFNSCILIKSKKKNLIVEAMEKVRSSWKEYDNLELEIIHNSKGTPHNTITPIVRKVDDTYYAYIILRNNRCSDLYPDGIFHAHKEYHNIKSEGIGLIEAMGLFILPARLERQRKEIKFILENKVNLDEYLKDHEDMYIHKEMILNLLKENSIDYDKSIDNYINETCIHILENTAVFKNNESGNKASYEFLKSLDL